MCRHTGLQHKVKQRGEGEASVFQENVQLYSKVEWEVCGLKSWHSSVSKSPLKVSV